MDVPRLKKALIVVDVQNDFVTGSLAVPGAKEIIPKVNKLIEEFQKAGDMIVYSKDYHHPNHPSFKEQGGLWPVHCVAGSFGGEFYPGLHHDAFDQRVILKGWDKESYSAFDTTTDKVSELETILRNNRITELHLCGIALEYCVHSTSVDAQRLSFQTVIHTDACASLDKT